MFEEEDVMSDRVILHCDCNSFFASVETVLNPAYKNVPMAVCGSEEDRRGIVLAKNELAKKYDIKLCVENVEWAFYNHVGFYKSISNN